jgi:hypothetical protein
LKIVTDGPLQANHVWFHCKQLRYLDYDPRSAR